MSWKDNASEELVITTGDGKVWRPLYMNSVKSFDFHIAQFNFPEVEGTLVNRGERMGYTMTMEIIFQGADHLETYADFELSTKDKRFWIIDHPMHGRINMQPSRISVDNTGYNTSKVTINLLETITQDAPLIGVDPTEQVIVNNSNLDDTTSESFVTNADLTTADTNTLTNNVDTIYNDVYTVIEDSDDLQNYFNLYQVATAAVLNATSEPLAAIQAIRAMITAPALFKLTIESRIDALINAFQSLLGNVGSAETPTEKTIFENNAGGVLAAMFLTTVYKYSDQDLKSTTEVLQIINKLTAQYDAYFTALEGLQTTTGDDVDSYVPDQASIQGLQAQANFTIANLLQIALNAQQEREIILEADSNIVSLTHRFYGLDSEDENIKEFIRTNNIGVSEKLLIKKGRTIKYYV